jgi:hypothetical protein
VFDPVLPENLETFRRFRRLQRWSVVIGPVVTVVLEIVGIIVMNLLDASDHVFDIVTIGVGMGGLGVVGVLIGYWEVRKTLIFHRDLRAREPAR